MLSNALIRRPLRFAAPLFVLGVSLIVSCTGENTAPRITRVHTAHADDELAVAVISGLRVRSELRLRHSSRSLVSTATVSVPLLAFPSASDAAMTATQYLQEAVLHFTQDNGVTVSVAFTRDPNTGAPTSIRVFEDGHLRYAVRPSYARYGGGWARQGGVVTFFDAAGDTLGVSNSETVSTQAAVRSPADALQRAVLDPVPTDPRAVWGACTSAKINYTLASLALAAAIAAVDAAAVSCGTTILTCPAMGTALLMFNSALQNWNNALDRLIVACGYDGGGGGDSGTKPYTR